MKMDTHGWQWPTLIAVLFLAMVLLPGVAMGALQRSKGQTIYLSVIPQVQRETGRNTNYLGFLMTVRNIDRDRSVIIRSIAYHNAGGQLEKKILTQPLTLAPLASHAIGFKKKELALQTGMSGCMIVEWDATEPTIPVLVEGVVIGTGTGWTTGLVLKGVVIEEKE